VIRGTIDGKVRIVRLMGKGGMGTVYEGEDLRSGQRVAVKVMRLPGAGDTDPGADHLGRFQREARAAAAIASDHVARVLDWGTDPERAAPYMVLEYLEGEDVQALLKRAGAIHPDAALRIAAQACLGLSKAHEVRVIHRDIKPANLFLSRQGDGRVVLKILDFGIAKIRPERDGDETTGLTRTGGMLGSPTYMSPEQARGLKALDYRTDLWSLGIVLYRALTGHTPHDETEALGDLIVSICSNTPRPVQELSPWVPAATAAVVHGALQIHPDDRWASAAAMLDAIRPLLPDGWELHAEMLGPVDEATRALVAPRPPAIPSSAITAGGRPAATAASVVPPPATPLPAAPVEDPVLGTGHDGGHPHAPGARAQRSSRWQAGAAAAAATAAIAGGVYYGATTGRSTEEAGPAPLVRARAEVVEDGGLPHGQAAPPAPIPMGDLGGPVRAKLVVVPRDAMVEVDDAGAVVHDGVVDLEGAPGSVHRVRVSRGRQEASVDVTVTDAGAVPPRVELGVPRAVPPKAAPAPTASDAAPKGTSGPQKPLIPDRFE
jgi:serine/threonine-protein kinase